MPTKYEELSQEFDDFVYLVSHDMAASQRHVREFSKLLIASFGDNLTDEQKLYRQYVEAGIAKLDNMQAALLRLSRASTEKQEIVTTSVRKCLDKVVERLQDKISAQGAHIHLLENDLEFPGDEKQIETIFEELLLNALTFVAENASPEIWVSARIDGDDLLIGFQDRGIGIVPDAHEKVMTMFRRLHPAQAYGGGIGAGLTIARKLARRHQGDLAIDSHGDGQGTTVFLRLPIHPKS